MIKKTKLFPLIFCLISFQVSGYTNELIAVYDSSIISSTEYESYKKNYGASKNFDDIVNLIINDRIFINFSNKSNIKPSIELINQNLVALAKTNKLTIEELIKAGNFEEIKENITRQLKILLVKEYILKESNQKNLASDQIIEKWLDVQKEGIYFEVIKKIN